MLTLCVQGTGSHNNDNDDDELQFNYINMSIKPIDHNLQCISFTLNMLTTQSELTVAQEV